MTALRPYFAEAAARELETREKNYPAMIDAGEIARDDAAADVDAWRDIVAMFRDGSVDTERSWAQLELATSRAHQRCEEYLAEKPDNATPRARRDVVWAIHERIVRARWFWTRLGEPAPAEKARAA